MNAVTVPEILLQYESKLHELETGIMHARLHYSAAAVALAIAAVLFLTLGLYAVRQQVSFWLPSIPIPFAAAFAGRYSQVRESRNRMWRLKGFYERAIQRIHGNWVGIGVTGAEFSKVDHVYAADLNIFGQGSLFELLCIARTSIGQRGLANYLLEAPAPEETLLRQDAVRELQGRADLRERVASLGDFDFLESKWSTFEDWLGSPTLSYPRYLRALAGITSALLAGIGLAGLAGLMSWIDVVIWIGPLVAFHSAVGLIFRKRINEMQSWVQPVSVETQVFREGLRLLEEAQFHSVKLRQVADDARNGSESVRALERLLNALHERQKNGFTFLRSYCWWAHNWGWPLHSGERHTQNRSESGCARGRSSRR